MARYEGDAATVVRLVNGQVVYNRGAVYVDAALNPGFVRVPYEVRSIGIGDVFSSACPKLFAAPFDETRYATIQVNEETGETFWLYNTQGQAVSYNGFHWLNTLPTGTPNVFPPPTNWRKYEADGEGRAIWNQPSGAYDAYPAGFTVVHDGGLYRSLIEANTTTPAAGSQWWEQLNVPDPDIPVWQPWSGNNADLYRKRDQVLHNGQVWESTVNNNSWEPGVFGWVLV